MTNTNSSSVRADIVSAPAINNMTITPVGGNMFSLNLNVVLVVRFPGAVEDLSQTELMASPTLQTVPDTSTGPSEPVYADGTRPEPHGETAAFNDFVRMHGYPPSSRDALSVWVQSQQGAST